MAVVGSLWLPDDHRTTPTLALRTHILPILHPPRTHRRSPRTPADQAQRCHQSSISIHTTPRKSNLDCRRRRLSVIIRARRLMSPATPTTTPTRGQAMPRR